VTRTRHAVANRQTEAAGILEVWLRTRRFPDRLLPVGLSDRAFAVEAVYGAVKWARLLRWQVRQCARHEPSTPTLSFALIGLYQIFFMDSLPDHAAVHETVEGAKSVLPARSVAFVNAVLRRALRERVRWQARLAQAPTGLRFSHPDPLIRRWLKIREPAAVEALCAWNNARPAVIVHIRNGAQAATAPAAEPDWERIGASPHPFAPERYRTLPRGVALPDIPGFAQGLFFAQDPSGSVAVDLLDPQPGHSILDACAAPGGKTAAIAERIGRTHPLIALDRHADRVALLTESVQRLNLTGVAPAQMDATDGAALQERFGAGTFDRILLDAPCSNTGVLQRRPDARWRFAETRLTRLVATQRALLDACAPLLKPGGTLVYSVCSLEPEEGAGQVNAWLAARPDFTCTARRSLFPPISGTDGIFAAALCRTS
jgi:16S rRNA (cytosine967-C5)-methyltransferase